MDSRELGALKTHSWCSRKQELNHSNQPSAMDNSISKKMDGFEALAQCGKHSMLISTKKAIKS